MHLLVDFIILLYKFCVLFVFHINTHSGARVRYSATLRICRFLDFSNSSLLPSGAHVVCYPSRTRQQSPLQNKNVVDGTFMMRRVMPVGALGAMSLFCGNFAYLYLSVSFIQMLKVSVATAGTATKNMVSVYSLSTQECR